MTEHILTNTVKDPLYVITTLFNPQRFKSRVEHYRKFEKHVLDSGGYLVTVEAVFGDREKVVTQPAGPNHLIIHVTTHQTIWLKENMINIAISKLPKTWKYCCWVDADLHFNRWDWVQETKEQLQHFDIVQMFSQIVTLSPEYEYLGIGQSFMAGYLKAYEEGKFKPTPNMYADGVASTLDWQGAPGGAWAVNKHAYEKLGNLIDFVILGSADYYMALGLVGAFYEDTKIGYDPEFIKKIKDWQENALNYIQRNVGLVKGLITHYWHGKNKDRGYETRWKILVENKFNPDRDLVKDDQGLYQLKEDKWKLRDDIRRYFEKRNEDSIDVK